MTTDAIFFTVIVFRPCRGFVGEGSALSYRASAPYRGLLRSHRFPQSVTVNKMSRNGPKPGSLFPVRAKIRPNRGESSVAFSDAGHNTPRQGHKLGRRLSPAFFTSPRQGRHHAPIRGQSSVAFSDAGHNTPRRGQSSVEGHHLRVSPRPGRGESSVAE